MRIRDFESEMEPLGFEIRRGKFWIFFLRTEESESDILGLSFTAVKEMKQSCFQSKPSHPI